MGSDGNRPYPGLLVDWGGVLTTNLFDSFRSFCELEGIAPDEIRRLFREDRTCRQLLIDLETGKLPEDHRTMVILRDMVGLSYQEMAEATGITEGTVKSRLSRARTALKQILD